MADDRKAGYGAEDFSSGGFERGRIKVITARFRVPKAEKPGVKTAFQLVIDAIDQQKAKQSLWISLGGTAEDAVKFYKPLNENKALGLRTSKTPGKGSKYGLFMESLRNVGFPMTRVNEMDLAALDGCTLDIDSKPMQVGDAITASRAKEGKGAPTYYIVTAFTLPGGGEGMADGGTAVEDGDDEGDATPESKLLAFVTKAVAKAGEPVKIAVLKSTIATKFESDGDVDAMVALCKLAWCEANGFTVDKAEKTVGPADAD
jgi:hypothetical protein